MTTEAEAPEMPEEPDKRPKVEAVERALTIVEAFADGTARLSLSQLAQRTGFYPSTILRLFGSLQYFGYLSRDDDGFFRLGPSLWRFGVLYQNAFALERHVRPVLKRLVDELGETAAFYIREGARRVCLYRRSTPSSIGHLVEEGAELPLDRGASAHVLVAFTGGVGERYETIRREQIYVSYGERNPDANAVAVPVFGQANEFVGALSIVGPTTRLVGERIASAAAVMRENAELLSRTLRGR
jgi:DNA-binding IclR family transcriptional regulator